MSIAHKWQPISDLPADPRNLTDGELDSLQRVWRAQKDQFIERIALDEFDKRLRREWAIETGIIEDVYSLDRGVTQTLIEKGINAALIPHDAGNQDGTLVARLIQDHYDALEAMFDFVAGRRQFSTSYVKEIHAALLRNVDVHVVVDQFGKAFERRLEKGLYKAAPNSPTRQDGSLHEYCAPEHVASEMDALIQMHLDHEPRKIPPEVEAAWLHHRFTQIHPFADGNGRVARAISSLVFIKAGWFPLIIRREDKARYIEALEKADDGELRPLVSLFVEAQRNVLVQATEVAYDVRPIASAHEAVLAARDRLLQRGKLPPKEWLVAKELATQLLNDAIKRFGSVATELSTEIGSLGTGFGFRVSGGAQAGYDNIRESAVKMAGQTPEFVEYNGLAHLNMQTGASAVLTLSFHAIGPRFRGLIGVVPYLMAQGKPNLIEGATYQINYEEDLTSATTRFSAWLDDVIVKALNVWRLTL
jgi:fido (protein-threonine AMPylation protein)